ncbi:MAG: hypothetical protein ACR2O4_13185 [Hyphomicrobiaceae bacterium]
MISLSKFTTGVAYFALLFMVESASAAVVRPISGEVFANTGQGFLIVKTAKEFPAGTQVLIRDGSEAVVEYGENCIVPISTGVVQSIATATPCNNFADLGADDRIAEGNYTLHLQESYVSRARVPAQPIDPAFFIAATTGTGAIASIIISVTEDDPVSP